MKVVERDDGDDLWTALMFFWTLFSLGFWHISLVSHPRRNPPDVSAAFGIMIPAMFCAYGESGFDSSRLSRSKEGIERYILIWGERDVEVGLEVCFASLLRYGRTEERSWSGEDGFIFDWILDWGLVGCERIFLWIRLRIRKVFYHYYLGNFLLVGH
jgi:hypothetical protein